MRTLNALTASVCSGGKDHRTITVLDAKGRNFAELDDISELQLLKRVVLDNNEITSLAGLKDNTDLESVSARNNAISEVNPADMAGWTRLVFLDLSHNKLTQLEALPRFEHLRALLLNNNALRTLPKLAGLPALKKVMVSHNQLETLDWCLWASLQSLEALSASGNLLKTLPSSMSKLHSLTNLRLNRNRFTTVPACIAQMSRLALLDLGNNRIATLDSLRETLAHLPALRNLNLQGNPVCDLDEYHDAIRNMLPNLQVLDGGAVDRARPAKRQKVVVDDAIDFEEFAAKPKASKPDQAPAQPAKALEVRVIVKKVAAPATGTDAIRHALGDLERLNAVIGLNSGNAWEDDDDSQRSGGVDREQAAATSNASCQAGKKRRRQKKKKTGVAQ
ncbi:U2A'/phosphoprotein 32 family A C-terminal domain-containing protein [Plasmodiophora brassicae]